MTRAAIAFALLFIPCVHAQTGSWSTKTPMPQSRSAVGVGVIDGIVYAVGGFTSTTTCSAVATVEAFNPATNTWSTKAPLPATRFGVSVAVVNGILYAIGGSPACGVGSVANVDAYDPSTNTWTPRAPMPGLGRSSMGAGVIGGLIYVAGGFTGALNTLVATVEAYNPATNTWSTKASLPSARYVFASAVVNNTLYVIGGAQNGGATLIADVVSYDPVADSWTSRQPLGGARCCTGAGVINGKIHVVGGSGGAASLAVQTAEVYDPAANAWTSLPSLPGARTNLAVAAANGVLYAIGGQLTPGSPMGTVTAYTPASFTISVTKSGSGTVTSSPSGIDCGSACSAGYSPGTLVTLSASPAAGSVFAGWSGAGCGGTGNCVLTMDAAKAVTASFTVAAAGALSLNPGSLAFGGQSVSTTSPPKTVTISNTGGSSVTVSSVAATANFSAANDCAVLAASGNCTASVTFTPSDAIAFAGTLTVGSTIGTKTASLTGTGERSLTTHYYLSILRRDPDVAGKDFWEAEAARVVALGSNVNEVWYSMTMNFFFSPEYRAFNRSAVEFLRDLYKTFFNREPDTAGLNFWNGQIAAGLPREAVLASFTFSPEFSNFTQAIFGNTGVRPEVNTVMDFYRGAFSRMPDSAGYAFWLKEFRIAQCQGGDAVNAKVESISSSFFNSPEYAARNRTHTEFVTDLYNAFMRRGADLAGAQFYVGEIAAGRKTRDKVRQEFMSSPEFSARVSAIIGAGCQPPDLAVITVDNASPTPLTPIRLQTTGVDPASPVTVAFTNAAGFSFTTQSLGVETNGDVIAAVPLYVAPGTGQITSGAVSLKISQAGRTSVAIALNIQDLPAADPAFPPGLITRAYYTFNALLTARRINQLQAMQAIPGNTAQITAEITAAVATLQQDLRAGIQARDEIDRLMKDASLVIGSAALPDGTLVRMDRNALLMMDRVFAVHLKQAVAAVNSLPKSAAKSVSTASEMVHAMEHTKEAYELAGNLHEASHDKNVIYKGVALTEGALTLKQVATGKSETLGMVGALLGATKVMVQVGGDYRQLFEGWRGNNAALVEAAIADLHGIGTAKLLLTAGSLAIALPATVAFLGSAAVPASLALAALKLDMTLNERHKEIVSLEERVAGLHRFPVFPQVGFARGTRDAQSGLTLCCFGSGALGISGAADADGNFDLIVPLGIPGTSYGSLTLRSVDAVTSAQLSSTVVDLRGLSASTPVQIPTVPQICNAFTCYNTCFNAYLACYNGCGTGIAGLQCMSACDRVFNACPSTTNLSTCACTL